MYIFRSPSLVFAKLLLIGCVTNGGPNLKERYNPPSEVMVRGSDIETNRHSATLALRDALEAEIVRGSSHHNGKEKTVIYIPDDVMIIDGTGFRYRALLVDSELRVLREKRGACELRLTERCAKAIADELNPSAP